MGDALARSSGMVDLKMAKLKGPLLSVSASGSIGTGLTYSSRRSGAQVRFQRKQKDVDTPARTAHRADYTDGVDIWNTFSDVEKALWNTLARSAHLSGYNLFLRYWLLTDTIIEQYRAYYGLSVYGVKIFGSY